jgi:DNA-binding XRE family transcriptional regulator
VLALPASWLNHSFCSIYRGAYFERVAPLLAWICETCSPPTCADCDMRRGFRQDDLAHEAEVSRSYLSQLEKGVFYASLKIIGRLAEALEVEPAELLKRGAAEKERR